MVGVLIVTHGRLGEALLESAGMISGNTDGALAISFWPGQGVEDLERSIEQALSGQEVNHGVLCLVDLPGGSPARAAALVSTERSDMEVVAGVNLPMLVEVLLMRSGMSARELARLAGQAGRGGIVDVGEMLRSRSKRGLAE